MRQFTFIVNSEEEENRGVLEIACGKDIHNMWSCIYTHAPRANVKHPSPVS